MTFIPPPPTSTTPTRSGLDPEVEAWLSLSLFLVVIGIFQWASVLHSKVVGQRRPRKGADEESTHTSPRPRAGDGWSLARLPLAVVNVFRVVAFRWTIEFGTYDLKMADVFLTLAYVAFLLVWTFVENKELEVTKFNISRWSGRAGVIAASQFPLVTALGTKNNVVSLVTGVGYEKLNYLHRVTARSCFALLLIHTGGEIYSSERIYILLGQTWLRFGITAMVSLTILSIVSLRGIRTRAYELFFYTHFFAVFIFLLGAYFHTNAKHASLWIWPSFMFWALDRFMRVARVVVCNHLYCGFGRSSKLQDAATELLCDKFVRVRVRRPPHFQWSPGQTAYLIMPSVSTFPLEAHPFSISSIDSALFHPGSRGEHSARTGTAHWKELVFVINIRGGFTKRLREVAAQNRTVKLFIDGPYGSAPDMRAYDTSIFVAGGSGITYTLPVFLNVIEAARKGFGRCRRVVFIWAVRDPDHVQWISDALSQANALTPSWLTVSIRIFATTAGVPCSDSPSVDSEHMTDKEDSPDWVLPPSARLEYGRPDLKSILHGEVNTATGSMSVTVCGSQSLTRSVRRALRFPVSGPSSILSGGPSVTLHVESFGYA
ncbi:putative ferric reductase [Lanmaoa asiatica]|nr:putative ferric reductase [Lanmaoa asiatica]